MHTTSVSAVSTLWFLPISQEKTRKTYRNFLFCFGHFPFFIEKKREKRGQRREGKGIERLGRLTEAGKRGKKGRRRAGRKEMGKK